MLKLAEEIKKSDDKELILDFLILESALIWSTLSKGEDTAAAVCSSANRKTDMGIYEFISSCPVGSNVVAMKGSSHRVCAMNYSQ